MRSWRAASPSGTIRRRGRTCIVSGSSTAPQIGLVSHLPSSLRLGSSAAAPPGSLLLGVSSLSAVPIAATPPAITAAAAAFLAARLIFDRVPEDDFFFACDGALAFVDLFAFD